MTLEFPDRTREIDENLWLEDIHGEKPLDWVREQNERTMATFDVQDLAATRARVLEVYDSDDRIPMVTKRGDWLYNFWQDADHPRGLWRRTSMKSYKTDAPEWEILLDVDALGKTESKEWVFKGGQLCYPEYNRALLSLSPDGGDAVIIREFDVTNKTFVDGGFEVPYAKTDVDWIDVNTIFVSTDFGEDSLTISGYPRQVRRLKRGQPLEDADIVHTIPKDHMVVNAWRDHAPGYERELVIDIIDFFNHKYSVLVDGQLETIDIPSNVRLGLHHKWMTLQPKYEWSVGDQTFPAGSLLAINFDAFMAGSRDFTTVFTPDSHTSLQSAHWTHDYLLLNLIQDVSSRITIATPGVDAWSYSELETIPLQTTSVFAVDEDDSNEFWMVSSGFLQPTTLSLGTVGSNAEPIKSTSAMFDSESVAVEQHFATSADGTKVPYFQIGPKELVQDGSNPTLLYGYGGFEISHTPAYDAATGRTWLEQGGVYVVANIRGGGEYGPEWHTSALKENRHRAYEDFSAVAKDLIDREVTSAAWAEAMADCWSATC